MPLSATEAIANFDSAAAMLRALGNFLHGKDFPGLGINWGSALMYQRKIWVSRRSLTAPRTP